MNFLSLQYFLAVAQYRSMKEAARHLFMTQQSLSEHIRRLEDEVGLPLFERTRPLRLTTAGVRMLKGAEEILDAKQRMDLQLHYLRESEVNALVIGVTEIGRPPFISSLLAAFLMRYPGCAVKVVEKSERLSPEERKEIGLHFLPQGAGKDMLCIQLRKDSITLAVQESCLQRFLGKDWKEAADEVTKSGELTAFSKLPYIVTTPLDSIGPKQLFRDHGFEPLIAAETASDDLNFSLCLEGVGGVAMPWGVLRNGIERSGERGKTLRLFRLKASNPDKGLNLYYDKGHSLSEMEEAFIRVAKEFFAAEDNDTFMEGRI